MNYINKYLRNLSPYKLASHKVWNVTPEERKTFLKLDWNEATVPPSPLVKQRMKELVDSDNFYHLYPSTNNERLYQVLSNYAEVEINNVQYFGSSDALHEYIAKVYISVGDPVLILGPSYDNFRLTCEAQGARVYYSEYEADFSFDPERLDRDIECCRPAVIYLCNPNNPTGNLHSTNYICSLLERYPDTLFIVDEAYYEFTGVTVKDFVEEYQNLLVTRTMSKAFALANFRVGYLLASETNIRTITKVRNPKNLSTFAQEAAIAALTDVDYMRGYVHEVLEAKKWITNEIARRFPFIEPHWGGGNFFLLRLRSLEEKESLFAYLESKNIFVRNLAHSELLRECLRVTVGTKKQMECFLGELQNYYEKQKIGFV